MQSGLLDGGVDGEYNGVSLVKMSEICVTHGDFFLGSGTICFKKHVDFIPNIENELNWNVTRDSSLFRHEISNVGLVSLTLGTLFW